MLHFHQDATNQTGHTEQKYTQKLHFKTNVLMQTQDAIMISNVDDEKNTDAEHMSHSKEKIREFSHAMRVYRMMLDINQDEFVTNIEISLSTYRTLEGIGHATDKTINAIESALGQSIDEILEWFRSSRQFANVPQPNKGKDAS